MSPESSLLSRNNQKVSPRYRTFEIPNEFLSINSLEDLYQSINATLLSIRLFYPFLECILNDQFESLPKEQRYQSPIHLKRKGLVDIYYILNELAVTASRRSSQGEVSNKKAKNCFKNAEYSLNRYNKIVYELIAN